MKSLPKKLVKVTGSIKRVGKDGRNDFHKYDYVKEADILEAVRDALVKENVLMSTSVKFSQKDGDLTSVVTEHTFYDGDSEESLMIQGFGQGIDKSGDKGGPKAITSATKYALMKFFMIPTGDDPEATDENGKSTKSSVSSFNPTKKVVSSGNTTVSRKNTTEASDDSGW